MHPHHESKNTWPSYERSVLDKLDWLEKKLDDLEKRLRWLERIAYSGLGALALLEFILKLSK